MVLGMPQQPQAHFKISLHPALAFRMVLEDLNGTPADLSSAFQIGLFGDARHVRFRL